MDRAFWEQKLRAKVEAVFKESKDPAHDLAHFQRVVATALKLAEEEGATWEVVLPAAWLHDLVEVPKNDPRRSQASRLSGEAAVQFLRTEGYPENWLEPVRHAVEAHSYSAKIEARSVEAQVVQDADRLDGLGAIGVARCFAVGGILARRFYDPVDPFAEQRAADDQINTLDHFYVKLFKTVETLKTAAGKREGQRRAQFMRVYLAELKRELGLAK